MQVGCVFRKTPVAPNQQTSSETRSAHDRTSEEEAGRRVVLPAFPVEAPPGTETASAAAAATPTAQSSRKARSTWKERSMWRLRLPAASSDPAEAQAEPQRGGAGACQEQNGFRMQLKILTKDARRMRPPGRKVGLIERSRLFGRAHS